MSIMVDRPPSRRLPARMQFLKWHRWLTLVLLAQLTVWLITAFGMTMVPRAATTAYTIAPPTELNAVEIWPDTSGLSSAAGTDVAAVFIEQRGFETLLAVTPTHREAEPVLLSVSRLAAPEMIEASLLAAYVAEQTGERITEANIRLKTRHSPEYQKLPLPAWRVEAEKAVLFFDPYNGELLEQVTPARLFENWMTTIHVMDYTGKAQFRQNVLLSFMGLTFLAVAIFGVLPVRRVYMANGGGLLSLRLHQLIGIVLAVQVFFWVTSGLGTVWLLHPLRDSAEEIFADQRPPIEWERVKRHPVDLVEAEQTPASKITLTMLLGEPVYQMRWPGRPTVQKLFSAEDGREILLDNTARDRIAQARLQPAAALSVEEWQVAESRKDLDYYFYVGPYPAWKGYFSKPMNGVVTIDQITGHVHVPRTKPEVSLEVYYKTHVVYWREGVIRYRREPVLLAVIGLLLALTTTGFLLHMRRWERNRKRAATKPGNG